jgi:hypothetical protein
MFYETSKRNFFQRFLGRPIQVFPVTAENGSLIVDLA